MKTGRTEQKVTNCWKARKWHIFSVHSQSNSSSIPPYRVYAPTRCLNQVRREIEVPRSSTNNDCPYSQHRLPRAAYNLARTKIGQNWNSIHWRLKFQISTQTSSTKSIQCILQKVIKFHEVKSSKSLTNKLTNKRNKSNFDWNPTATQINVPLIKFRKWNSISSVGETRANHLNELRSKQRSLGDRS